MNIIILILIAAGIINSADQFTAGFQHTHSTAMDKANSIYYHQQYNEVDGGVVIDDDVNPEDFE